VSYVPVWIDPYELVCAQHAPKVVSLPTVMGPGGAHLRWSQRARDLK
jgi:hypothetical protein